ncbi:MAG: hypothetical protein GX621_10765 [Pirellulaceae bacterium]|nr:hypothetical protein [Pirellulaceae bacterium]
MALIKDLINFCWFIFKWGIVPGTIVTLAVVLYLHQQLDTEIRGQIESRFAEHYHDLAVAVRAASRVEGEGIEIRDLSIKQPGTEGPQATLLHVEQAFFRCNTELADLLGDRVHVRQAVIRRPTVRFARMPDGTWSGSRLWPVPALSDTPPDVTVENGTIEIIDLTKTPPSTLTFRDVNLTVKSRPPDANDPGGKPVRVLEGTLRGDHMGRIEIRGEGDPAQADWRFNGTVHDLDLSAELHQALPAPLAEQIALLAVFRGRIQVDFDVQSDSTAPHGYRFDVKGRITEGRFDDRRLPDQFRNIRGSIQANNEGLVVENLFAQSGRATLWISRGRAGFGPQAPWSVKAKVTQLQLDSRLRACLPEPLQERWDEFQPLGQVDADMDVTWDGRRLDMAASTATVELNDVAFTYAKFPYPLDRGRGKLKIEGDVLSIDVTARVGDRPLWMRGSIKQPLDAPRGRCEARGEDLPVDFGDERLLRALAAMNDPTRGVVQSLSPRGLCDFGFRAWRDAPDGETFHEFTIDLKDFSICFDRFRYPVRQIQGRIERFADGRWAFRDLRGTNDTAQIACNGNLAEGPRGKQLSLVLQGKNVLLEDNELRGALKPSMQQAWDNLDPRGMIDFETDVTWQVGSRTPHLVVIAWPHRENTSIKPRMFPYQMERLEGTFVYRDGQVLFDRFAAWHGRTRLSGKVHWNFLPDGSWNFRIEDMAVDRLSLEDRELRLALPAGLREGLAKWNPSGPMYLHKSRMNARHPAEAGQPMEMDWDLRLGFHQARIECGIRLENMHGELQLRGQSQGHAFTSLGELDISSLLFENFQFTDVKGPIQLDNHRLLLGSWVARSQRSPDGSPATSPRPIEARLFGGQFLLNAWIAPKHSPCYSLNAGLIDADLAQFAKQTMPGPQDLKGRVGLTLDLRGRVPSINGMEGEGRVWLRDGDVYQLPVMVSILKILSLREPDSSAFSEADMRFRIAGKHVYLSPISFNGDAISLLGQGEMEFPSKIDLAFRAVVGRNKWYLPLISPIMDEASRQTMTINVRGTLQDPKTSRDVLPAVTQALRELETNLQSPANAHGQPILGRPILDPARGGTTR